MPLRDATQEEIQELQDLNTLRDPTDDELKELNTIDSSLVDQLQSDAQRFRQQPLQGPPAPVPTTVTQRIVGRFTGTDVDDPEAVTRLGTSVAGGLSGGLAGARIPGGPLVQAVGAGTGGLIGTVAGVVAPEKTVEYLERFGFLPKGSREKFGLTDEQLREVVYGEALLELVTLGTFGGGKVILRPFVRSSTGLSKQTDELADGLAAQGIDITPFQLGNRKFGEGIVNVFGRFPIIGGKTKRRAARAADQTLDVIEELPERTGSLFERNELGQRIFNEATTLVKNISNQFDEAYTDLFKAAEDANIVLEPQVLLATRNTQREILTKKRFGKGSQAVQEAIKFIDEELGDLGQMTFSQADDLSSKIDQFINGQPENIRRTVGAFLNPFRDALKADLSTNLGVVEVLSDGTSSLNRARPEVRQISQRMQSLDSEFNQTMSALFETATARKFGSVQRGGLRSAKRLGDLTTNIPVDQLASKVINMDSPQAVDELFRLVTPETRQAIAARMISDQFERSIRTGRRGEVIVNMQQLRRNFGLTPGTAQRREALTRAIKESPLEFDELERIVRGIEQIQNTAIPDFSTFIARRATIGGVRGATGGVLPKVANGIIGSILFLGGARGLVDAVGNPKHARSLKMVMTQEASEVVRRAAFVRLLGGIYQDREEIDELTRNQRRALTALTKDVSEKLFPSEGQQ